jgi:hypothetical protein
MLWNCSDGVVCFGTVPTVWYVLELFEQHNKNITAKQLKSVVVFGAEK